MNETVFSVYHKHACFVLALKVFSYNGFSLALTSLVFPSSSTCIYCYKISIFVGVVMFTSLPIHKIRSRQLFTLTFMMSYIPANGQTVFNKNLTFCLSGTVFVSRKPCKCY